MQISVIIPSFNRERMLMLALDSVLKQSSPPHEIIVVDDGSDDDTRERLEDLHDEVRILSLPRNTGVSNARNQGITHTTGEWLAFLDSDDRWHRDKLETQIVFHETHPEYLISQCDEIWVRNGVRVNPMRKHAKHGGWIFEACLPRCIVSPSAVVIHRSIFKKLGTFDVTLPACEDYDLWLRIAQDYEIGFLPKQLLTRYGGHEDQLSRKHWGMDRFRIRAMEKHIEATLDDSQRKALFRELAFKCGVVAEGALKRENVEMAQRYQDKCQAYQNLLDQLEEHAAL